MRYIFPVSLYTDASQHRIRAWYVGIFFSWAPCSIGDEVGLESFRQQLATELSLYLHDMHGLVVFFGNAVSTYRPTPQLYLLWQNNGFGLRGLVVSNNHRCGPSYHRAMTIRITPCRLLLGQHRVEVQRSSYLLFALKSYVTSLDWSWHRSRLLLVATLT